MTHPQKNILIIFTETAKKSQESSSSPYNFVEEINVTGLDPAVKVDYTFYNQLVFSIVAGVAKVYDRKNDKDLKSYDLVYFRKWSTQSEEAVSTALYLEKHGVKFVDTEVLQVRPGSKLSQYFLYWANDLPVPDTLYASPGILVDVYKENAEDFRLPIIVKKRVSRKGHDNHLLNSVKELEELSAAHPEYEYLIQNFVPNDFDYRVFVCGYEVGLMVKRSRKDDSTHLNNYSAGGTGELMDLATIPQKLKDDSVSAARALHREVAGVDMIINKETGEHILLEVNKSPQINTMVFGEEHSRVMREFLLREVNS